MGLTNAERQARWRERQKQKLAEAQAATTPRYVTESRTATLTLSPDQVRQRDLVGASTLLPVPDEAEGLPTFLGWNCHEWASAPIELATALGLRSAWEGWARERESQEQRMRELRDEHNAVVARIVAEHGKDVCDRAKGGLGTLRLVSEYHADPTLSKFKTKKRVT